LYANLYSFFLITKNRDGLQKLHVNYYSKTETSVWMAYFTV